MVTMNSYWASDLACSSVEVRVFPSLLLKMDCLLDISCCLHGTKCKYFFQFYLTGEFHTTHPHKLMWRWKEERKEGEKKSLELFSQRKSLSVGLQECAFRTWPQHGLVSSCCTVGQESASKLPEFWIAAAIQYTGASLTLYSISHSSLKPSTPTPQLEVAEQKEDCCQKIRVETAVSFVYAYHRFQVLLNLTLIWFVVSSLRKRNYVCEIARDPFRS